HKKMRADFGISYADDALKLIGDLMALGLLVRGVVITRYTGEIAAQQFRKRLEGQGISVWLLGLRCVPDASVLSLDPYGTVRGGPTGRAQRVRYLGTDHAAAFQGGDRHPGHLHFREHMERLYGPDDLPDAGYEQDDPGGLAPLYPAIFQRLPPDHGGVPLLAGTGVGGVPVPAAVFHRGHRHIRTERLRWICSRHFCGIIRWRNC
ncbi:MAG: DUF1846 family protein, partial [Clostridia bacterium]|nr:DUF1846 family protein [Clostridia bacterium]